MQPSFWHDKWASQQIGFHLGEVNPLLINYWQQLGVAAGEQVFVPLCGKSLDMCFLAEQGLDVIGCELNQSAVEQFFSENQLSVQHKTLDEHQCYQTEQVTLYQGDIFSLPAQYLEHVSAFYDRAALIAWPEEMRLQYAKQLARLIPASSVGLLITLDYPQQALSGPPFAVSDDWVMTNMSADFEIERLSCLDVLADNPRFIKKQVPWLTESVYLLRKRG
ncbi:thiopurine S-methyltransferase [Shewanella sp. Isolate11]|uniref:thiopurine S-methyltransferase n=1 Tax=Shewanella sp. Isolate11 TaxID=2908530 RepID=UPI001EFCD6FA|nr:thiopurine S-methyltransferase [Shewanella sp. Isolate11]MCG9695605.1 thiopurine S-methyltransferase [Shewanella sp. Isolate11]